MNTHFTEQQRFQKAQKKVNDIKGFYIHLLVYCLVIPIIITVNMTFSPGYHWFWFSTLGWGFGLFFHWLGVFGFQLLGFGKDWEERKIKELMNKKES